uniref:LysR substrate-binding domain-containing protein n=1 Tax=Ralstonia solanacearum TaxID=305 RepID=A0A0S4TV69_RALSL|nr:protein of unknown function [Ralstonia solanacearum]
MVAASRVPCGADVFGWRCGVSPMRGAARARRSFHRCQRAFEPLCRAVGQKDVRVDHAVAEILDVHHVLSGAPRPIHHEHRRADAELAQGRLVPLLPEWRLAGSGVYAITPRRDAQPLKVTRCIEHLRAYFARLDA